MISDSCRTRSGSDPNARKSAYLYKLTPKGLEEKARITCRFLKRKQQDYEELKAELEELEREAAEVRGLSANLFPSGNPGCETAVIC